MDLVLRSAVVFFVLLIVMRLGGNKQFSELTAFDAVLIIVVAEVTGNSLSGQDFSLTASIIVIVSLVFLDISLSWLKARSKSFDKLAEGVPVLVVENGKLIKKTAKKERIDEGDIMAAARRDHGIERMDEIRYAVLEKSGTISVIPR